ncbi:MAG: hypothetical protein ABIM21_06100 [candidate division WOR-3 bacterium]
MQQGFELHSPEPAYNPYLAFACMLHVGLKGIEKRYKLLAPIETDVYHLSPEEKTKNGYRRITRKSYRGDRDS